MLNKSNKKINKLYNLPQFREVLHLKITRPKKICSTPMKMASPTQLVHCPGQNEAIQVLDDKGPQDGLTVWRTNRRKLVSWTAAGVLLAEASLPLSFQQ